MNERDETVVLRGNHPGTYPPHTTTAVTLTIIDNARPGVTVSASSLMVTEGGTNTYTVKLNSRPSADVTVTPASSAVAKATVSGALTFTPSEWNTPKTVTVTGVEDADDGERPGHHPAHGEQQRQRLRRPAGDRPGGGHGQRR